jgi:hypothetical protein
VVLWFRVDERWCRCRQRVFELVTSVANIACDKLGFDGEEGIGCGESLMAGCKRECRLRRGLRWVVRVW